MWKNNQSRVVNYVYFMGFLYNFERWKHVLAGNEGQNNKYILTIKSIIGTRHWI